MFGEENTLLRDDRGCGGGNGAEVCPDKGIIIATHYCSYELVVLQVATGFFIVKTSQGLKHYYLYYIEAVRARPEGAR